ncbi:MAG: iron chelate uptake ABC transporter family permease subunit [Planctomycetota bacterium]
MDYNTRLVIFGAGALGAVCGLVGVYLLLRKRSLIGDAICHASLPGIALGFFASVAAGGDGRDPRFLLVGAAITGVAGALTVLLLRRWTILKDDAALGIVLSVYFGFGMVLLSLVQQTREGNAAGLEGFIYGNTAGIMAADAWLIAIISSVVVSVLLLLRKELQLLCFDSAFAASQGWPTFVLDLVLLACVLVVVIIGTSIVGVLLIIAMVVIPPAAARFWSDRMDWNLGVSASMGLMSGVFGALSSLALDRIPSGAAMVLMASFLFGISMLFGAKRGMVWRWIYQNRLSRQADGEHVLRTIYERLESQDRAPMPRGDLRSEAIPLVELAQLKGWTVHHTRRVVSRLVRGGWMSMGSDEAVALTASGIQQSLRAIRRPRLLEHYFARWAELSPDAIDRSADYTEHALDDALLAMLEKDALAQGEPIEVPPSIHPIS